MCEEGGSPGLTCKGDFLVVSINIHTCCNTEIGLGGQQPPVSTFYKISSPHKRVNFGSEGSPRLTLRAIANPGCQHWASVPAFIKHFEHLYNHEMTTNNSLCFLSYTNVKRINPSSEIHRDKCCFVKSQINEITFHF